MGEVGLYGIGNRLVIPLSLLFSTLLNALYPKLSSAFENDRAGFDRLVHSLFVVLTIGGSLVAFSLAFLSKEIIPIVFSSMYVEAVPSFVFQLWFGLNMIAHSFLGFLFLASNNEGRLMLSSLFNAVWISVCALVGSQYGAFGLSMSIWAGLIVGFSFNRMMIIRGAALKLPVRTEIGAYSTYVFLSVLSILMITYGFLIRAGIFLGGLAVTAMLVKSELPSLGGWALEGMKELRYAISSKSSQGLSRDL
jgi:O-antigen/teichoic acid export membrane protein